MMVRLAEKVIEFYENPDEFYNWLKTMEKAGVLKRVERKDGVIAIAGKVNTGVSEKADPINNLVLLGFAFFGEFWAFMPDIKEAFDMVKKWWKAQIKEGKKVGRR